MFQLLQQILLRNNIDHNTITHGVKKEYNSDGAKIIRVLDKPHISWIFGCNYRMSSLSIT